MSTTPLPRAYRPSADRVPDGVLAGQQVADLSRIDQEVVVFVVGMRVHRWRKVRSWWGAFVAMPRMLKQLQQDPDLGLLEARLLFAGRVFYVVQYWRSAEHLGRFAKDPSLSHQPAWAAFNKRAAGSGDIGIFHETYRVPAANIESRYANMPPFGLGRALGTLDRGASGRNATDERIGSTDPDYAA